MANEQSDDRRRREAEHVVRIAVGVEKVSRDWRVYLGLVIAAPDQATLLRWTCESFDVERDVARALLDEKLNKIIGEQHN